MNYLQLSQLDYLADTVASQIKKIAELEFNEREYERILGPKSYNELALDIEGMRADALRYRAIRALCISTEETESPGGIIEHCWESAAIMTKADFDAAIDEDKAIAALAKER